MEEGEGQSSGGGGGAAATATTARYTLPAVNYPSEDILFCIDVGPESMAEMKVAGPNGRPFTRLDCMKQAINLFIHAKLTINPDHRFAFTGLGKSVHWLRKEFSSEFDSATAAFRGITVDASASQADLTLLFRAAAHEAKKSIAQNRILRVVLLYCRSSMLPQHQWPAAQRLFTMDVIYLHDKPGPENCPQKVYDSLVEALEHVTECEGYIFESGHGLTRVLFRHICTLLSHPYQRCLQDEVNLPKPLTKKLPVADTIVLDESAPVSSS